MDRRTLLMGAAGMVVAKAAAAQTPVSGSSPFTVEGVISQQSKDFPNVRAPDLPPTRTITAQEDVVYLTRGSEKLALDIYRPAKAGACPAVLMVHGGGWESGSRQMERSFCKRMAALGFVAIPVSYRLGEGGRFPGNVLDLKAAVRWVRAHAAEYDIDSRFVAIAGGSAGGHLAAFLGASNGVTAFDDAPGDSRIDAVVDIDGAASFPDAVLIKREEERLGATSRYLGGNYSTRRETWFAASPLTYVGRQSAPTLFINSNRPTPVLPGRPEMKARLNALGIVSEIIDMPAGTPHPFWLVEPWFTPTIERTAAFLMAQYKVKIGA
ncbi:alpha/beta hydrolase [Asticcacaulis sp. BYS171W]|uniref:Alpha/beta hydrolase n=1 Tax=Asticcacaulis aquaticus TaxID=2984212 RepID=A0ABT5HVK7_9CAUL|nr:alpha/beta hydrolase [Asticcacaulis aquaticus]MDC7683994.1 alpha/beta hydrolase [Asticcacaulis aquaticus]